VIFEVKLFAVARQMTGRDTIEVRVPDDATVGHLRRELTRQAPSLETLMPHLMIAVDAEYADDGRPLRAGDEVACIPPVSGG
jgi:molybdopterin converting factor subunit 1